MPSNSTKIQCACAECGKTFLAFPSAVKRGQGKYCSRTCHCACLRSNPGDFWSKVDRSGDCWLWTGRRHQGKRQLPYGVLKYHGKMRVAHCLAYALTHGEVPAGLCVLHRCDNPPCCNPAHLFLGTRQDNIADCVAKKRNARGERHASAKLTEACVQEIRSDFAVGGKTRAQLAAKHKVNWNTINRIVRGQKWKHLLATTPEADRRSD